MASKSDQADGTEDAVMVDGCCTEPNKLDVNIKTDNQIVDQERRYPQRTRKLAVRDDYLQFTTNSIRKPLQSAWGPENRKKFLHNLQTYGDQDVALLSSKLIQKRVNPASVYNYLQRHKELGCRSGEALPVQQRLKKWVEVIKDKKIKQPQPNPSAQSMLLISLLEDHPVPTNDEVKFAEAYEFMFQLLAGRNFNRRQNTEEGKYSEPTLKFIKLTFLKLLKEASNNLDLLHNKFVHSANKDEPEGNSQELPDHIQHLLAEGHLNPLELGKDALTIEEPSSTSDGSHEAPPATDDTSTNTTHQSLPLLYD